RSVSRMARAAALRFACGFICALALGAAPALAQSFETGIARSHMIWQSQQKQAAIFAGIKKTGVGWFRDDFSDPPERIADFVNVVRQAKAAGLKMLVVVTQSASDYDNAAADNAGPAFQKLCGFPNGSLKLSQINVDKFKSRLRGLLAAAQAARLAIDAFEIGNEVDWVCFNGDVPFQRNATADDVRAAARGYARFLEAAAGVIRANAPRAKIITAGLAHIDDSWDKPPRSHLPEPAAFMASLRNLDGKNYLKDIDGYGVHIYPDANDVARSTAAVLAADRAAYGAEAPLWITEFGFRSNQFPNRAGQTRGRAIELFFEALSGTRLGPVFYYGYDDEGFSLLDGKGALLPEAFVLRQKR
ncbi:MAG: hypothetical protein ABI830_11180, partial [Pseudolabrys sp.]